MKQTLTFAGAEQQTSNEFQTDKPSTRSFVMHIALTGCALTAAILQIRPVPEADFEDYIGGSSATDWSATSNQRLRDVSSTLTGAGIVSSGGNAWASVDLSSFTSARLKLTSGGAGSAIVRMEQQ